MRKDHRPYLVKKAFLNLHGFYARRFLRPQFDALGKGYFFLGPWHVEVFGAPVEIGNYATVVATGDNKVRFSVWARRKGEGGIRIGNYGLICPGVRISSAQEIVIGESCMMASKVYITDSDWHDIYDRIAPGKSAPVKIEDNVWIGDSAIICKGVTIGENSIIGAGAVVVNSVPPNSIAAGNPARVVKPLDPDEQFTARAQWYSDPVRLFKELDQWDRAMLLENTLWGWLRSIFCRTKRD
ncbi:MAG: acyltransferase [Proteobacteria bacterium]|nr:acyltransferase [Pseudomonadota bacterium]